MKQLTKEIHSPGALGISYRKLLTEIYFSALRYVLLSTSDKKKSSSAAGYTGVSSIRGEEMAATISLVGRCRMQS